jgi:small subunit ribosomal protein S8
MYTDLLTKVKNAQRARKEVVKSAYTNFDFAIAEILAKNNYVDSVAKKGRMPKRVMEIKLKYNAENKKGAINDIKLLSTPSRRLYIGYEKLRPVKQGFGLLILSTPKGLMTGKEARKAKLGGQLLFEIW